MARDATYTVTIRGIRPLLMHNGQLADPLNDYAKELSRLAHKKQKSDEDHVAVGQAEFQGSLYHDDDAGVVQHGRAAHPAIRAQQPHIIERREVVALNRRQSVQQRDHLSLDAVSLSTHGASNAREE